jgi:hypothetical protein
VNVGVNGQLGLGGVGMPFVSTAKIKSTGDIAITDSARGLILKAPNGTCYRVTVSNAGALVAGAATCP